MQCNADTSPYDATLFKYVPLIFLKVDRSLSRLEIKKYVDLQRPIDGYKNIGKIIIIRCNSNLGN